MARPVGTTTADVEQEQSPTAAAAGSGGSASSSSSSSSSAAAALCAGNVAESMERYAAVVDRKLQSSFYALGKFNAERPWTVIMLSIVVTVLCSFGFAQFTEESRPEKLWVPQGTRSQDDRKLYESHFPPETRLNYWIAEEFVQNDDAGVISKQNLLYQMDVHDGVVELEAEVSDEFYDLQNLCVKQGPGLCFMDGVLANWDWNRTLLEAEPNDTTVLRTLNAQNTYDELQQVLGEMEQDNDGNVISAAATMTTYYLEDDSEVVNGEEVNRPAERWEGRYLNFLKAEDREELKLYRASDRSFEDTFGSAIEGDIALATFAYLLMILYMALNLGGPLPDPEEKKGAGDEAEAGQTTQNGKSAREWFKIDVVATRIGLSLAGVLAVGLAMVASIGLASGMGIIYTPLHNLYPFVSLAIGVDDAFVLVNAFDQTKHNLPIRERTALAMAHAGVSVSVTSLTDFVAFAISSATILPALSAFCVYASFGILFLYAFACTFFCACMVLDAQRQEGQRWDILCCITRSTPASNGSSSLPPASAPASNGAGSAGGDIELTGPSSQRTLALPADKQPEMEGEEEVDVEATHSVETKHTGFLSEKLEKKYAPMLLEPRMRVFVIVCFVGFWCWSMYSVTNLTVEDNQRSFIPSGSYFSTTLDKRDRYFGTHGREFYVVTEKFDYYDNIDFLVDIKSRLSGLDKTSPHIKDPFDEPSSVSLWIEDYLTWYNSTGAAALNMTATQQGRPENENDFYDSLRFFLDTDGAEHNVSVVFSGPDTIVASRLQFEYKSFTKFKGGEIVNDGKKMVNAMDDTRKIVDDWELPTFPWTYDYIMWETLKLIEKELIQSVLLCMLAVGVIITVVLGHPVTSALVFVAVSFTVLGILAAMPPFGLVIDNVSTIMIVLSIGLSVDYSAHIAHSFMVKQGTREERVARALGSIGPAVLNGAISTFLAVVLLSTSVSYVFRVIFKLFFLTVVLGLGHGIICLPVLLSILGPEPYSAATLAQGSLPDGVARSAAAPDDLEEATKGAPPPAPLSTANSSANATSTSGLIARKHPTGPDPSTALQIAHSEQSDTL